jgi:hypothetical protein
MIRREIVDNNEPTSVVAGYDLAVNGRILVEDSCSGRRTRYGFVDSICRLGPSSNGMI